MLATPSADIKGTAYSALISFAQQLQGTFTLVTRDGMKLISSGSDVIHALAPSLLSEQRVTSWPGTELRNAHATMRRYRLSAESAEILRGAATSVYEWKHPRLPEDLAFFTTVGNCWFGSVAHENDAFFDVRYVKMEKLLAAIPALSVTPTGGR